MDEAWHVACPDCWKAVPAGLQRRAKEAIKAAGSKEHVAVLQECIKVLAKFRKNSPDLKVPAKSGRYKVTTDKGKSILHFKKAGAQWGVMIPDKVTFEPWGCGRFISFKNKGLEDEHIQSWSAPL